MFFFCPPRFLLRRATENATPEVKICVSPARNVCPEFFLASRCSAVEIFVHLVVTPRESTDLDTRCVSGGQNLRFACAGPQKMQLEHTSYPTSYPHNFFVRASIRSQSVGLINFLKVGMPKEDGRRLNDMWTSRMSKSPADFSKQCTC